MRLVTLFLIIIPLIALAVPAYSQQSVIISSGIGESSIFPNKGEIQFDIESDGIESELAAEETAVKYLKIANRLKNHGYKKDDIITVAFRVNNKYEQDPTTRGNKHIGYTARHAIKLVVTDFSKIGSIVDSVLKAGASRLASITFTSTKIDELRDKALTQAVKRAHKKAKIMAITVGGELGKLIEMETGRGGRGVVESICSAGGSPSVSTTIVPDILRVYVSVNAKWEYLPAHE